MIWGVIGIGVAGVGLSVVARVVERRRARHELARWEPTGIRQTFEGHDQTLAVRSAERARRQDLAKRKLHAQRSQPGPTSEKVVDLKDRTGR
jgi:hypothetical protein